MSRESASRSVEISDHAGTCPCCGAEIPENRVALDMATHGLAYAGRTVHLRPMEARLCAALINALPGAAHPDRIVSLLWGLEDPPLTADLLIKVHVSYLRRKLARVGLGITNTYGEGYTLRVRGADTPLRARTIPRREAADHAG